MKEKWDTLIALLTEIIELYKGLIQLVKQKNQAIIGADIEQIEALTQKEELVIMRINKLEAARGNLAKQLAAELGVSGGTFNLAKMRELAEPDIAGKLGELSEAFSAMIKELEPLKQLNNELIQQALHYINYNINLLSRNVASPTYAPQGQNEQQQAGTFRLLDRKI